MDHIRTALNRRVFRLLEHKFLVIFPGIVCCARIDFGSCLHSFSFDDVFRALRLYDDRAVICLQQVEFFAVICIISPESLHISPYFAAVAPHIEGESAVVIPDRVEPAAPAGHDPSLFHRLIELLQLNICPNEI